MRNKSAKSKNYNTKFTSLYTNSFFTFTHGTGHTYKFRGALTARTPCRVKLSGDGSPKIGGKDDLEGTGRVG